MAKITLDLQTFKSSGVYTVEFDATESITLNTQTVRLVVGFSRKGPFNAPVFIKNVKEARKIFGEIDTFLENKGSFFHRSLETALQVGPVFALNLLPLNNTPTGDKIQYRSLSIDTNEDNGEISTDLLASFFNKERFWFADTNYFAAIVNNNLLNNGKLMSFTNLGQKPLSILTKKSTNIKGFDLTVRDFYGAGNVPEYINDFDFISDFFIDVIVIEGDWSDYSTLSADPIFSRYFDTRGIKIDQLSNFLASDNITLVANFQGCIIPDFTDKNNVDQYIETIVNNQTYLTGVFMTINRDAIDDYENSTSKIDLIGHNLINSVKTNLNFLSYVSPLTEELKYDGVSTISVEDVEYNFGVDSDVYIKSLPYGDNRGYFCNVLVIPKPTAVATTFTLTDYNYIASILTSNSLIKTNGIGLNETDYVKVENIINTGTSLEIQISHPLKNTDGIGTAIISAVNTGVGTMSITVESAVGFDETSLKEGDLIFVKSVEKYLIVDTIVSNGGSPETWTITTKETVPTTGLNYDFATYDKWLTDEDIVVTSTMNGEDIKVIKLTDNNSLIPQISPETLKTFTLIFNSSYMYEGTNEILVFPGSDIYIDWINNTAINGDSIYANALANLIYYLSFESATLKYGVAGVSIKEFEDTTLSSQVTGVNFKSLNETYLSSGLLYNEAPDFGFALYSSYGNIKKDVNIIAGTLAANKLSFRVTNVNAVDTEVGYFLVTDTTTPRLTKITEKIKTFNASTGAIEYIIKTNEPVLATGSVTRYLPINTFTDRLQFSVFNGFTLGAYHLPGTVEQQEKIYGVIENTNLGTALKDRELISFRYIVDTFDGIIEPMMGAKAILSRLAKRRQKCLALLNAPSVKQFTSSTNPRFTEEPDIQGGNPLPLFKSEYVSTGGNLSLGPSSIFSLPDEENGSKFFGAFTPFLLIRENNRTKSVPPAADVSNNFVQKFINGTQYLITAGEKRGVLSNPKLVGVEYEYMIEDREFIEPFGFNPIITTKRTGPMIYGNQLGYQKTRSAFNNLHVRDLLITLEETIEDILKTYVWDFNDARTRLEVKTIVDSYLDVVRSNGGIIDFLTIMDESNNTSEIIQQNIGIIDIGIEPPYGLQKVINRLTLLKPGVISSGGFTVA